MQRRSFIAALCAAPAIVRSESLMKIVVPVMLSLAVIRLTVQVLHNAFPQSRVVALLERTVSWGIWLLTVLWVTGILHPLRATALLARTVKRPQSWSSCST